MEVTLYSDGSSRGNPGPGGYGTILRYKAPSGAVHEKEFSEGFSCTTNNRMELLGCIVGLEALRRPCTVTVYSDSQYHAVTFVWVKGHAGHVENERCDALATAAADNPACHKEDAGFKG